MFDNIYKGNPNLQLMTTELKNLFHFATAQTDFLFKGSFFDQIDVVAIGSPLAPVLANLFMGHHERIWLENFKASSILFYQCYVDDTLCLFDTEHDATFFFITSMTDIPTYVSPWKKRWIKNPLFGCSD